MVGKLGSRRALVARPGGLSVESSTAPIFGESEEPIDLTLEKAAGAFTAARALTPIEIPARSPGAIRLVSPGIGLTLRGRSVPGSLLTGFATDFPNVATDVDSIASGTPYGADLSAVLRSRRSPQSLRYEVSMPIGSTLRATSRGALVVAGKTVLARITAPTARDSQNRAIPVSMSVHGTELVLRVNHRHLSVSYPILVDPEITINLTNYPENWADATQVGTEEGGFQQTYPELYHCAGEPYEGHPECDNQKTHFETARTSGGPYSVVLPETVFPYAENEYTFSTHQVENRTLQQMFGEQYWKSPPLTGVESVTFNGIRWTASGEVQQSSEPLTYPTSITGELLSCRGGTSFTAVNAAPVSVTMTGSSENSCYTPARIATRATTSNEMAHSEMGNGEGFSDFYYQQPPTTLKSRLEVGAITVVAKASEAASLVLEEEHFGDENPAEPHLTTCMIGDPVNCATGNVTEKQVDISVPSLGPDLDFVRYYNSGRAVQQEEPPGGVGLGWTTSFSAHVTTEKRCYESFCPEEVAVVHQDNGSAASFRRSSPSQPWSPISGLNQATLVATEGALAFTLPDQEVLGFDASGRLTSERDRYGNTLRVSRNGSGLVEKVTDASGRALAFTYNAQGSLASVSDPMGRSVKYTYGSGQSFGTLASVTQLGGTAARWKFRYAFASRLLAGIADALGHEATFTYGAGKASEQVDRLGHVRTFKYASLPTGSETILKEPNGSETVEKFDLSGQPVSLQKVATTPLARTTQYTYDAVGRLLSVTTADGKTSYEYDTAGNRTLKTEPGGAVTRWGYNQTRDVVSETRANGRLTTIERNTAGGPIRVTSQIPGLGTVVSENAFNSKGELTSSTDPAGRVWTFGYDANGDRTSAADAAGDKATRTYNADSQELTLVSPRGNVEGAKPSEFTTTYTLNALGQITKIVDPLGRTTASEYDALGNLVARIDSKGAKTEYSYNAERQPIKIKRPVGNISETGYDAMGQVTSQTDANGKKTVYVRNLLGQITEIVDPLGKVTRLTRTPDGNVSKSVDPEGNEELATYDAAGNVKELTFPTGGSPIQYTRDQEGRISGMSDESGQSSFAFNQAGLLTEAVNGHGETIKYEYNLAGQVIKIIYPGGKSVTQSYDKVGRLASVTDWLGHAFSFSYDPDSNLSAITFPSASAEVDSYSRNRAGEITEVGFKKGSQTLAKMSHVRSLLGQVEKTTVAGLPGPAEISTKFDTDGRLVGSGSTAFQYDGADSMTSGPSGTAKFDAGSELTEAGTNSYSYDSLGNRRTATVAGQGATSYSFSPAGFLKSVVRPKSGSVATINDSYIYNGTGLRMSANISGATNFFTWNQQGSLPVLLSDGRFRYVYGPFGVPLEQVAVSGEQAEYLHLDQSQTPRLVTDASGQSTEAVSYKPYGGVEALTGSSRTAFGFAGQYGDADTGLVYMRARYYDPATGQFISRDPLGFETRAPYSYAGADPLDKSDPSGLCNANPLEVVAFFTEENCLYDIVPSSLNFGQYYVEEIESAESGCGYWDTVSHGLEGSGVLTLDTAGAGLIGGATVDAGDGLAEYLATRYPAQWQKFLEYLAGAGLGKPGFAYGAKWLKEALAAYERQFRESLRGLP